MKRVFIGLGVSLIALICIASTLELRARRVAEQSFRTSRPSALRGGAYGFVTRGVRSGMSFGEVKDIMQGADFGHLAENNLDGTEPYFAYFDFAYSAKPFPGFNWRKYYISELYTVFFDSEKRVTRMKYHGFCRGAQDIKVNLQKKTLSEPLRLPWRED